MAAPIEPPKAANTGDLVTVSNVAEIFNAAGFAFKKLGELVQQLDSGPSEAAVNGTASNGLYHWDANDVEQFQSIITNCNDELSKLSSNLKNKMSARLQAEHTDNAMARLTEAERASIKNE